MFENYAQNKRIIPSIQSLYFDRFIHVFHLFFRFFHPLDIFWIMATQQTIWFILNPKSGTLKPQARQRILDYLNFKVLSVNTHAKIRFTEYAGHATLIAQEAVAAQIDVVIAIGGDGTINEVAKGLLYSNTKLGIIPIGSGNGLARHLGISMNPYEALEEVLNSKSFKIDACFLNEIPFFCTAGLGFDAQVAHHFAKQTTRGLWTYIKSAFLCFFSFKPVFYDIQINGENRTQKYFTITFANATQYGNDALIAPNALINDGLIDVCLLKPYPFFMGIYMAIRLFWGNIDKSEYMEIIKTDEIKLSQEQEIIFHFDGEPAVLKTNQLNVKIKKQVLNVICPLANTTI